jgi:hypothetical protein
MYDLNETLRSANCSTHGQIGSVKAMSGRVDRPRCAFGRVRVRMLPLHAREHARAHTCVR